jgi:hypothetical protein
MDESEEAKHAGYFRRRAFHRLWRHADDTDLEILGCIREMEGMTQ